MDSTDSSGDGVAWAVEAVGSSARVFAPSSSLPALAARRPLADLAAFADFGAFGVLGALGARAAWEAVGALEPPEARAPRADRFAEESALFAELSPLPALLDVAVRFSLLIRRSCPSFAFRRDPCELPQDSVDNATVERHFPSRLAGCRAVRTDAG
jgi:hypothetical protein